MDEYQLKVTAKKISEVLKHFCGLTYRKALHVNARADIAENKILRQLFCIAMVALFEHDLEFFATDQSAIVSLSYHRKGWFPKKKSSHVHYTHSVRRCALTVTVSSKGRLLWSMHRGNNNSKTMMLYYNQLFKVLKRDNSFDEDRAVFLQDNAAYQVSEEF